MQQLLSAHLEPDSGNAFSENTRCATPPPPLHRMMMKIYRNLVLLVEFSRPTVTASPTSQQAPQNFVLQNSDSLRKEGP
jgi:hypothetical protein